MLSEKMQLVLYASIVLEIYIEKIDKSKKNEAKPIRRDIKARDTQKE